MSRKPLLLIAIAAALAVGGGVAYATIPDGGGAIHGCYGKVGGLLRVIDTATSQHCTALELPLQWNQQGSKGDPGVPGKDGAPGTDGAAGKDGAPGKDGVSVTSAPASVSACPNGGVELTAANGISDVCNGAPGAPGKDATTKPGNVFVNDGASLDLPLGSYAVNAVLTVSGNIGDAGRNLRCTLSSSPGATLDSADVELPASTGAIPQLRVGLLGMLQTAGPATVTVGCITPANAAYPIVSPRIVATTAQPSDLISAGGTSLDVPAGSHTVDAVLNLSGNIGDPGRNLRCTLSSSSGATLDSADVELPESGGAIPQLRVALIGVLQTPAPASVTVGCITPANAAYPITSSRIVATAVGSVG